MNGTEVIKRTGNFYTGLPPWGKAVFLIGSIGITVYTIHFVYQKFKKASDLKDINKPSDLAGKELKELSNKGIKQTINQTQLEIYCQSLMKAIGRGCFEDEDTVFNIMKSMKNDADLLALIKQFGVRYVDPCPVSSPISYVVAWFDSKNVRFAANLIELMKYGMNGSEIKKINDDFASRGIKYRF